MRKDIQLSGHRFLILLLIGMAVASESLAQTHIRFLNWNDFHASNVAREKHDDRGKFFSGGAALLKGALNFFRADTVPVLAVHAGDEFQGTPISSMTRGASQIHLLNMIKPDIYTIGNHEFDYGRDNLDSLLKLLKFPVICANLFDQITRKSFVNPYKILQVGQVKVGFIGLILPELRSVVFGDNIKNLQVREYQKVVQKNVAILKDSVDLIVVLSHMGIEHDRELAQWNNDIDIIFGGHSHTIMRAPENINGVLIFQAGSYGRYLGRLDLWVDTTLDTILKYDGHLLAVDSRKFSPDPAVQAVVDSLEEIVGKDLDQVIAVLKSTWVKTRNSESNIGNWITDAYRNYSGADIAFQNSGGIRKGLSKGPVTKRDFWEIAPFGNYLVEFSLSGRELLKILTRKVRGSVFQVSGMTMVYNPEADDANAIKKLLIDGKQVDLDKIYRIATVDFVYDQLQNDFAFLKQKKLKNYHKRDRYILIEAAEKQKVLTSKIEGRLKRVTY